MLRHTKRDSSFRIREDSWMARMLCIAVDWSGNRTAKGQRNKIWLAKAEEGNIVDLIDGFTRDEIIVELMGVIEGREAIAFGLDFAFSFPQWYLECRELPAVRDLWKLAGNHGEQWLAGSTWPFWGRTTGIYRTLPKNLSDQLQFRQTEREHIGYNPQSVFKLVREGHVGTGTIRGLPLLIRLRDAGAPIWPFDAPRSDIPTVVEIYPRLFYGDKVTNKDSDASRISRKCFLEKHYNNLGPYWRKIMVNSPDAFDAGVSALHMSLCVEKLRELKQETQPPTSLEGRIWYQPIP